MTAWLQCPVCGSDLFESDDDGLFWTDTEAVCLECAAISWIDVDDSGCDLEDEDDSGSADVRTNEETADVGQPLCNGTCGLEHLNEAMKAEILGKPCPLSGWGCCPRAETFGPLVEVDVFIGEEPVR